MIADLISIIRKLPKELMASRSQNQRGDSLTLSELNVDISELVQPVGSRTAIVETNIQPEGLVTRIGGAVDSYRTRKLLDKSVENHALSRLPRLDEDDAQMLRCLTQPLSKIFETEVERDVLQRLQRTPRGERSSDIVLVGDLLKHSPIDLVFLSAVETSDIRLIVDTLESKGISVAVAESTTSEQGNVTGFVSQYISRQMEDYLSLARVRAQLGRSPEMEPCYGEQDGKYGASWVHLS